MDQTLINCLVFLVFAFIIMSIPISMYYTNEKNNKNIRDYLEKKGCQVIDIEVVWFDRDRDTNTYHVTYIDEEGNPCRRTCKIRYRDSDIYWKDSF